MSNDLKLMTRREYYASRGFSGSEIDRPDDLIDDNFIKHIDVLEGIMNKLIDNSKKGINVTFIEDLSKI